jgi:cathepsin L
MSGSIIQSGQITSVQREANAPPALKLRLAATRARIKTQNLKFKVRVTGASMRSLKSLTGDVIPPNIRQIAQQQNALAAKVRKLDLDARNLYASRNPGKLPELKIQCNAGLSAWDWRKEGKVTPVRDQQCGSCWAYAVVAALESSYLIRNNKTVDGSEQYLVSNSGAGDCSGGQRDLANAFLVSEGDATNADLPDSGTAGTPNPNLETPYDAIASGFVDPNAEVPSVAKIKEALCEYGPLSIGMIATQTFQDHDSGVFNEPGFTGGTPHAITLIGWNDSKNAWLIKNSWGTDWGETCDFGTEKGYAWVDYGTNKIGRWAQWIQAENTLYRLPPAYYQLVPKRKIGSPGPIKKPFIPVVKPGVKQ